jgi:hypothetical protein
MVMIIITASLGKSPPRSSHDAQMGGKGGATITDSRTLLMGMAQRGMEFDKVKGVQRARFPPSLPGR